jgi:esterase
MLNFILHQSESRAIPLLVAHGLFGSARNWNVIAKKLSADREVIAVDMRNHGDSLRAADHSYADLAQDLAQVIEQVVGRAFVLGHSMGGKAAMVLALSRPELVAGLVVADIAPVAYSHSHAANITAMRSVDLSQITRRSDADAQLALHLADPGLRAFFLQSLAIGPEGAFWKLNLDALENAAADIVGFPEIEGRFIGPTMFLKGEKSEYISDGSMAKISALFPAVQHVTIADAGHWLQADQPAKLVEVVGDFLRRRDLEQGNDQH